MRVTGFAEIQEAMAGVGGGEWNYDLPSGAGYDSQGFFISHLTL